MMVVMAVTCAIAPVLAQDTSDQAAWTPPADPTLWFGYMDAVYAAIIIIVGYLSKWIPGLNEISSVKWRVVAFVVLTGAGLAWYGVPLIKIAITYFFTTSLYELVLKDALNLPSPKGKANLF